MKNRSYIAAFAVCVISLVASLSATASEAPQLAPAIEQCIRDNAPKVERAIPDLNEAMTYLVNGICSEPIGQEYDRLLKIREQQSRTDFFKMCEQSKSASASSDKSSGQLPSNPLCRPELMGTMTSPAATGEDVRAYGMPPHSAAAVSLAAKLLLDLRLAHQNSKSQ